MKEVYRLIYGIDGYKGFQEYEVEKDFIEKDACCCEFGKWINAEKKYLKEMKNVGESVCELNNIHENLHLTYNKIYKFYFPEGKSKILNILSPDKKKKLKKEDKEKVLELYSEIEKQSGVLLKGLKKLKEDVKRY